MENARCKQFCKYFALFAATAAISIGYSQPSGNWWYYVKNGIPLMIPTKSGKGPKLETLLIPMEGLTNVYFGSADATVYLTDTESGCRGVDSVDLLDVRYFKVGVSPQKLLSSDYEFPSPNELFWFGGHKHIILSSYHLNQGLLSEEEKRIYEFFAELVPYWLMYQPYAEYGDPEPVGSRKYHPIARNAKFERWAGVYFYLVPASAGCPAND